MKVPLAKLSDIPEGDIKEVDFFERSVFLTRTNGRYRAFVNVCTHLGGPLGAENGHLVCQWHQACFSLGDGNTIEGPARRPLMRLPVIAEGDELVYVYGD